MNEINDLKIRGLYSLKRKIILVFSLLAGASIITAMIVIALLLRKTLIDDSRERTRELTITLQNTLKELMIQRSAGLMQNTIDEIAGDGSIARAFIIDRNGRIIYSSMKSEIGTVLDRNRDPNCTACHSVSGMIGNDRSVIINDRTAQVQRNVSVIFNEKKCFHCHPESVRINGKLIIDRSMHKIESLIVSVESIMFISGLLCLVSLFVLISWGVNKYISKLVVQYNELSLLYTMVDRISKVIDLYELKDIVLSLLHQAVRADQVAIVIPFNNEFRATAWSSELQRGERMKIEPGSPFAMRVHDWMNGRLEEELVSGDRMEIYYPIVRKDERIALVYIRRDREPFDSFFMKLIQVVGGHISVAFENAMLYKIAITDELTGLYSYRHFRGCLIKMLPGYAGAGETGSLLMLDIDNYKAINDRHGHLAGDSVLKEIALCIFDSIRDTDMAFRYGGEEFAVLLPQTGSEESLNIAERIRKKISEYVFLKDDLNLKMTISIGVSTYPDNAELSRDLIYTADQALYEAKKRGKNLTVVSSAHPVKRSN